MKGVKGRRLKRDKPRSSRREGDVDLEKKGGREGGIIEGHQCKSADTIAAGISMSVSLTLMAGLPCTGHWTPGSSPRLSFFLRYTMQVSS